MIHAGILLLALAIAMPAAAWQDWGAQRQKRFDDMRAYLAQRELQRRYEELLQGIRRRQQVYCDLYGLYCEGER